MEFNQEDIEIFTDIINRGKRIVAILKEKGKEEASKDEEFKQLFPSWKADSLKFMESHFDKSTTAYASFCKPWFMGTQMKVFSYIEEALTVMESYYKIPNDKTMNTETTNNGGIHINVEQHQSQTQQQSQQQMLNIIIEAIKDTLTGKQVKELREIAADTTKDDDEKKSRFIDKIKSFGANVSSDILANILTDGAIWASLAALL